MKKLIIMGIFISVSLILLGCSITETININILATTDLHGYLPYELTSYVESEKSREKNTLLVDAGDFFSVGKIGLSMNKYFDERDSDDKYKQEYLEVPLAKEMQEVGYDAVVLGNHEFIENNKVQLDNMVSDFEKQGIGVLSANTYKKNGENYAKPYLIKNISTNEGDIKVGILGLTIQEVGQKYTTLSNGAVEAISEGLNDFEGYNASLYMNDLVEDAKKCVKEMNNDKVDIIVAVVHSGESSKEIKYPGNRIQDLAKEVNGIDAIVGGHTHKEFAQHDYKNRDGQNVIVTQPGKYGECISRINFKVKKSNDEWKIVDKSSELIEFEQSEIDRNTKNLIENILKDKELEEIDLVDITPFEWDRAYVFKPNTSSNKIYKTIGYKWQDVKEIDSEDMIQMIFMKDNEVVCYLFGYEKYLQIDFKFNISEYQDSVITITPKENDKFNISIDSKWGTVILNHI